MQKVTLGLILSAMVTGLDDVQPGEFSHGAAGVARILANREAYSRSNDKYNARQIAFAVVGKSRRISFLPQFSDSLHSVLVHNFDPSEILKFRAKGETLNIRNQPDFVLIECGFMAEYVNSANETDEIMLA